MFSYIRGPCTPLLFQNVNINWVIRIDQNVSIGIFLMLIQVIFVIVSCLGICNLSTEPGYELFLKEKETCNFPKNDSESDKVYYSKIALEDEDYSDGNEARDENVALKSNNNNDTVLSNDSSSDEEECVENAPTLQMKDHQTEDLSSYINSDESLLLKLKLQHITLKELFMDIDSFLVIFSSSMSTLLVALIELQLNMLCLYHLKWSLNELSLTTLIAVIISFLLVTVSSKEILKYSTKFYIFYGVCFILYTCNLMMLMMLDAAKFHIHFSLQIGLVFLICFVNSFSGTGGLTFARLLMFTLVPSHSSSYCEGVRNSISRIFCGAAFYLAAPTFPYLVTLYSILILVLGILMCSFYTRRKSFI